MGGRLSNSKQMGEAVKDRLGEEIKIPALSHKTRQERGTHALGTLDSRLGTASYSDVTAFRKR